MRLYWNSIDPQVISVCRRNEQAYRRLLDRQDEIRRVYGVRPVVGLATDGPRQPSVGIGLRGDTTRVPGRWRKPDRDGIRRPYQSSREALEFLATLDYTPEPIPGLPADADADLSQDRVWASLLEPEDETEVDARLWAPCTPREYAARLR